MLSQHQVDAYTETGYIAVPEFFTSQETQALRLGLDRFKREDLARDVSTARDDTTHTNEAGNPLYDKSPILRALPFHPKIVETVTQLLGEPVLLQLDQILLKPSRHGKEASWHQDNAYFKISDPTKGLGVWIPLHDATPATGAMHVIPGCFREKFLHQRDLGNDHHLHFEANEDKAVVIDLPVGGVLFFCYGVPHCTKAKNTDNERGAIALYFVREEYASPEVTED